MNNMLKPGEIEQIIKRFGAQFYEKATRDIEMYTDKWELSSLQFIPSYSANLVFTCYSSELGAAVLKIGNPSSKEIRKEIHTLLQYNGRRFCKVFQEDIPNGVLLEQCIQPGNRLREESTLDQRLAVFAALHQDLHRPPDRPELYPTYIQWVTRITEYMSKLQDYKLLYAYMCKAQEICLSVAAVYSQQMLLHGDLHHDNILLGPDGEYILIDPKGVIGDPVFDTPRFILNEVGDEITEDLYKHINTIIGVLEIKLNIPNEILRQCFFVEMVMGVCWSVEDGASAEEYAGLLEHVAFAEKIMNGG